MKRENVFIAFTILVIACAVVFFIAYVVTERNRDSSVERLKAKAVVVREKIAKPHLPEASTQQPEQGQAQTPVVGDTQADTTGEDTITGFKQLTGKMEAVEADPKWKEALELVPGWDKWTEEERAKVIEFLNANRELISEIRRIADAGGPFAVLDYSKGFAMELSHLAKLRAYARLLAADAALASAHGDYGEMVKDLNAIMNLANAAGEEPILISQLVRIAITSILYTNVSQTVPADNLPPDMVRQLLQITDGAEGRSGFANTFSGEGLMGLEAFDDIRSGDVDSTGIPANGMDTFLMQLYGSFIARPFLYMDQEAYADIMGRMTDAMELPFYEAKPELERINTEIESLPRTRVLSRMLLPALTRTAEAQARNEAQLGLMRLGLAVELYHEQIGEYPQNLEDVAPTVGGEIPLDPFTGMPFVYEPRGNRFTLYSAMGSVVGPVPSSYNTDSHGNLVWRGQSE